MSIDVQGVNIALSARHLETTVTTSWSCDSFNAEIVTEVADLRVEIAGIETVLIPGSAILPPNMELVRLPGAIVTLNRQASSIVNSGATAQGSGLELELGMGPLVSVSSKLCTASSSLALFDDSDR
ncbi:MAG: hypothetical protein KDN22_24155 [Verrucomicrobiae bacterium]|nr:hypothetical protein [Verrucomicrobiae bacterium]